MLIRSLRWLFLVVLLVCLCSFRCWCVGILNLVTLGTFGVLLVSLRLVVMVCIRRLCLVVSEWTVDGVRPYRGELSLVYGVCYAASGLGLCDHRRVGREVVVESTMVRGSIDHHWACIVVLMLAGVGGVDSLVRDTFGAADGLAECDGVVCVTMTSADGTCRVVRVRSTEEAPKCEGGPLGAEANVIILCVCSVRCGDDALSSWCSVLSVVSGHILPSLNCGLVVVEIVV